MQHTYLEQYRDDEINFKIVDDDATDLEQTKKDGEDILFSLKKLTFANFKYNKKLFTIYEILFFSLFEL